MMIHYDDFFLLFKMKRSSRSRCRVLCLYLFTLVACRERFYNSTNSRVETRGKNIQKFSFKVISINDMFWLIVNRTDHDNSQKKNICQNID
jgi:hypothetical protein